MIRVYACFLVLLGLFFSCKKKQYSLPIPMEETVEMMIDVHSAESALQTVYGAKKDSLAAVYYQQIYQIYKIDSIQFNSLMNQMRDDPELMREIYNRAILQIEERPNSGD